MSTETNLRALASGGAFAGDFLLQTCRASAFGTELYGIDAITQAFRSFPIATEPRYVETAGHAALLWDDRALVADLAGGHVARLWRLGDDPVLPREPELSVPFDVDLAQAGAGVAFAASDHPRLDAAHAGILLEAGQTVSRSCRASDGMAPLHARPICLRAFSAGNTVIALFAVHVRAAIHAGFVNAVTASDAGGLTIIPDASGQSALAKAAWQPRIA
ncbi:hypothetical protein [Blastomonas sp.]|uniref:hypothetical protein n=1 Tax=Blastomonas sp. TaxID=1909299 RepID=UPI00391A52F7